MALLLAACAGGEEAAQELSKEEVAQRLSQLRIEPGLWERTSRVTDVRVEAVPEELLARLKQRGGTSRHCITPQQAAQPAAQFLAGREEARCRSRSFSMENGRMSGEMVCADPASGGEWTARLDGRYGASAYDLAVAMEMASPYDPGRLTIVSQVAGRRISECGPQPAPAKSKERQ